MQRGLNRNDTFRVPDSGSYSNRSRHDSNLRTRNSNPFAAANLNDSRDGQMIFSNCSGNWKERRRYISKRKRETTTSY